MSEPIIQLDPELGKIPREYYYDGTNLVPTDIVRIDGGRYRMVERKAKAGETVLTTYDGNTVTVVSVYKEMVGFGMLGVCPHEDYLVLEPLLTEEEAEPEQATEDLTEPPLTAAKIVDALAELSQAVVQQQREITELRKLTEENAKNTVTLAEDIERIRYKAEDTKDKTLRTDLTVDFLMDDIIALADKIRKLGGERG